MAKGAEPRWGWGAPPGYGGAVSSPIANALKTHPKLKVALLKLGATDQELSLYMFRAPIMFQAYSMSVVLNSQFIRLENLRMHGAAVS